MKIIAREVVEVQARLCESLRESKPLREYASIAMLGDLEHDRRGESRAIEVKTVLDHTANVLEHGYSYHVNPDMAELINVASEQLFQRDGRVDISFEPEMLPVTSGFAVMPHADAAEFRERLARSVASAPSSGPIPMPLATAAFSWGPCTVTRPEVFDPEHPSRTRAGYRFTIFMDAANHLEWLDSLLLAFGGRAYEVASEELRLIHELTEIDPDLPSYEEFMQRVEVVEPAEMTDLERSAAGALKTQRESEPVALIARVSDYKRKVEALNHPLVPVISFTWPVARVDLNSLPLDGVEGVARQVSTFLWTFFHMCNQTLAAKDVERTFRPVARRWRHMPMPKETVVIRLRRAAGNREHVGESNVQWSHKWIVRGHWHTYWAGPNRDEKRVHWLAPYVKGPEDAPLVITNKVYDLVR